MTQMPDTFTKALEAHTKEDREVARLYDKRLTHLEDAIAQISIDIKEMREENNKAMNEIKEAIKPLTEAYNGVLFGKKVLTGVSAVVLALATIGGGILYLAKIFKQ